LALQCAGAGCNGSGGDDAPPIGPDIRGAWSGRYFARNANRPETALTATIRQDGEAVMIHTSLVGIGANLTGTIQPNGDISLIDAFDGEIWTTHYRPATTNSIQIADFLRTPEPEDEGTTPIQLIELRR
jgi:hypothetical protein